jgi:hypothetical protein
MNYEICETIVDPAGKHRVRVIIDEYSTQFFKFDHAPSQEEVNSVVESYLQNLNQGEIL